MHGLLCLSHSVAVVKHLEKGQANSGSQLEGLLSSMVDKAWWYEQETAWSYFISSQEAEEEQAMGLDYKIRDRRIVMSSRPARATYSLSCLKRTNKISGGKEKQGRRGCRKKRKETQERRTCIEALPMVTQSINGLVGVGVVLDKVCYRGGGL